MNVLRVLLILLGLSVVPLAVGLLLWLALISMATGVSN